MVYLIIFIVWSERNFMKLIMKSTFDNLRLNREHSYDADKEGLRQIVRVYRDDKLIAKKKQFKKKIQYFGIKGCEQYLTD